MAIDLAATRQSALDGLKRVVPPSERRRLLEARSSTRRATARWRALPDVLVIGTMRGGTSSLYKYLGYHPSFAPSLRKEVEYFSRYYDRGPEWYRAHFPLTARRSLHRRLRRGELQSFEASPYYLAFPSAPARAARVVPRARIVALLRDPVDRAHSHWQLLARKGYSGSGSPEHRPADIDPALRSDLDARFADDQRALVPVLARIEAARQVRPR